MAAEKYTLGSQVWMALKTRPALVAAFGQAFFPGKVPKTNTLWPALVYQLVGSRHERGARRLTGVQTLDYQLRIAAKLEDEVDQAWQVLIDDLMNPDNQPSLAGPGWRVERASLVDFHMLEDPETSMPYGVGSLKLKVVEESP